jgi:hypothetical protein
MGPAGHRESNPGARRHRRPQGPHQFVEFGTPLTILPDQGIEIVAIEKKVMAGRVRCSAYWLIHDPIEAGYGPATK